MLDGLNSWWATIPAFERVFWFVAVPFSVLTVVQLVLEFLGGADFDVGTDVDTDTEAGGSAGHGLFSGLGLFTVKNLIIFLTMFGWTGIASIRAGVPSGLTIFLALTVGFMAMFFVGWVFYLMGRLSESGTTRLDNAIGLTGTVYLPIPADRKGKGQIQVVIQGATREIDAITYDEEDLKTGMNVTVIELVDGSTVAVTKSLTL